MNIERILNMVIRQVMRRLVNKGIGAGINAATKGRGAVDHKAKPMPPQDLNAAEIEAQDAAKLAAKRARKAARLGRRF